MSEHKQDRPSHAVLSTAGLERPLPCPFCGGDAIGIRYEGQPARQYAFCCGDCLATVRAVDVGGTASGSEILFDNPSAIALWNTRSNVEDQPRREASAGADGCAEI